MESAQIIVATPEKWDSVTRRFPFFVAQVALLCIDEVHILDSDRGGTLETVVSRMKMLKKSGPQGRQGGELRSKPIASMRTIALSATLPNVDDLGRWLDCEKTYDFGPDFRPVRLDTHVIGCTY